MALELKPITPRQQAAAEAEKKRSEKETAKPAPSRKRAAAERGGADEVRSGGEAKPPASASKRSTRIVKRPYAGERLEQITVHMPKGLLERLTGLIVVQGPKPQKQASALVRALIHFGLVEGEIVDGDRAAVGLAQRWQLMRLEAGPDPYPYKGSQTVSGTFRVFPTMRERVDQLGALVSAELDLQSGRGALLNGLFHFHAPANAEATTELLKRFEASRFGGPAAIAASRGEGEGAEAA
jgi:hypothetical protein